MIAVFRGDAFTHQCCGTEECGKPACVATTLATDQGFLDRALFLRRNAERFFANDMRLEEPQEPAG